MSTHSREKHLTCFEATEWRDLGFAVTQLTFEATSLHARELYRIEAVSGVEASEASECDGHPAGTSGVMGETVYCDGSCRKVRIMFAPDRE